MNDETLICIYFSFWAVVKGTRENGVKAGGNMGSRESFSFILLFLICLYFKMGDEKIFLCFWEWSRREKEKDENEDVGEKENTAGKKSLSSYADVV